MGKPVSFNSTARRLGLNSWVRAAIARQGGAILRTYGIAVALAILVALVASGDPAFVSKTNIFNMLGQWAPAGIMAVGMTYVVIVRGFDLSIASGFSLCAIVAALVGSLGYSPALAFLAAISAGLVIGLVNAVLVSGFQINPFIATVGTGFILFGINLFATPNTYILVEHPNFDALGSGTWHVFPYKGMFLLAFLIVGGLILAKTVYGQYLYAIGGNPETSRLSGLRVRILTGGTYVISGLCMGVAGMLAGSQLSSAQASMEPTIVFDVIAIVVLGGTSLSGGVGAIWRTAVGLAILATLSNGFTLLGLDPFFQNISKGAVLILALALDVWARRLSGARLRWSRFERRKRTNPADA